MISDGPLWFTVHCRFQPNDALIAIIEAIPGVEWVSINGKYALNIAHGKMFPADEMKQEVASRILEFIGEPKQ
ncbi:hypothetical protein FVR03_01285 [Pontibacter qinzhouensis]|uniref:Uncharacterized protein n=2 Tax=Pontibacter qinzhouensis TaxID=2603253 RepID=A0A5C8KCP2_9BACT|nr:hypothetical protein FVR03_01285 [Pontibacter qinzhouensis]